MKTSILAVVFVMADAVIAQDNPCNICPDGVTAAGGDDYDPFQDGTTCAEMIQAASSYETGTEDCGWAELYEPNCCYSEPVNPCNFCPDGVTAAGENPATCGDLIADAMHFESGSDACALYDVHIENCCPSSTKIAPMATPSPEGKSGNNGIMIMLGLFMGISFVALVVFLIRRKMTASYANGAAPATDPEGLFRMPHVGVIPTATAVAMRMDPEAGVSNGANRVPPSSCPSRAGDSNVKTGEFPFNPFVRHVA
jgi:hypothetical protein